MSFFVGRFTMIRLVLAGGILAVVGVVAAVQAIRESRMRAQMEPFDASMSRYATDTAAGKLPEVKDGAPYVTGKLYVMSSQAPGKGDLLHFDLTDGLRAEKPEDVGTVVLLARSKAIVGKYGASAN